MPARTTLRLEGWGGFSSFKSIITRVTVASQGNFQFLHTLGGNIFVYVFGDRIGQISISGLSFDTTCGQPGGKIGIEHVIQYYNDNRIAGRKTPVKITIGVSTTLQGYIIGFQGDVVDPKSRIYQFTLQLAMPPIDTRGCEVAAADDEELVAEEDEPNIPIPGDPLDFDADTLSDSAGNPIPTSELIV
jgi:hypothetical protein